MASDIQGLSMSADAYQPAAARSVVATLLPIMAAIFVAFLVTGLAMPVLPLHVHDGLGLGAFVVGLVAGAQFTASLLSRFWSGSYADSRGGKRAVVAGLLLAAAAGLLYFLSLRFVGTPVTSATILLVGRAVLGGAESFIITGALGALRRLRLHGDSAGDDARPARHAAARPAAPWDRPDGSCPPPLVHQGGRCRLDAGRRSRFQQRRLRGCHDLRRAALRPARMGYGVARTDRLRRRLRPGAPALRPPAGSRRRRASGAVRCADRGCRAGACLARAVGGAGAARRGSRGLRLLARLPGL